MAMLRLLRHANRKMVEYRVVALWPGTGVLLPELHKLGVSVTILGRKGPFGFLRTIISLRRMLSREQPDILACSLFFATLAGRFAAIGTGVPVINWEHNERLKPLRWKILRLTAPLSRCIIADSHSLARKLIQKIGFSSQTVVTVPIGGLDLEAFSPGPARDVGGLAVGAVGSLQRQKGFDMLVEMAAAIIRERPNTRFHVAGEGPERTTLEAMIAERGLKSAFILEGLVHDVPGFLRKLDVYVQPSRHEGLCITVVEAMACGLPVVAFDVGGIGESVNNEENGFLVEPDDLQAFEAAVSRLLTDEKLRRGMGSASRRIAAEKYDVETMARRFEDVLLSNIRR